MTSVLGFNLPIFPFESTAITVTTTVWVGVCIAVFFNLRLGWTLSGLVVPGYLVPLLMTRPITACVILVEAVITYLIVVAISEWPRKLPYWSSLFGRDRFFVILVVSVLVRAVLDGWALPYAGRIAVQEYGINFDYRNNLHSFGLIVVALIANYFWKPGLIRGMLPVLTTVGLTYAVVRFVLVGLTNFNVGTFQLLYEDVSTSLLASPKAYIIVLMTAYLASCFNLRYAWDFNGILIPALLGLLWHEPIKIVSSAVECVVILTIASCILETPLFRKVTMEGGRKLCFFFSVCFVYRLLICHFLPSFLTGVELSDTFGFGYLLSTLMAVRAHEKHFVFRMIRCITEVSMLGAVAGSLIGFAFYCAPEIRFSWGMPQTVAATRDAANEVVFCEQSLVELVRSDKILLYEKQTPESYQRPVPFELNTFNAAMVELSKLINDRPTSATLSPIARRLKTVNYQLIVVQHRYLYLREKSPANGWGIYVFDTQSNDGLCIEVPAPLDEWATLESGLCLFQRFPSVALAIGGAPLNVNLTGSADVTQSKETMFDEFHRVFGQSSVLQVRGYTKKAFRALADAQTHPNSGAEDFLTARSQLWIRDAIPPQLKLNQLKELMGSYDIFWNSSPIPNQLRKTSYGQFSELILNQPVRRRLTGQLFVNNSLGDNGQQLIASHPDYRVEVVHESLVDWMGGVKSNICQQGSDAYQPAKLEQMVYMDHEVITPLMELLQRLVGDENQSTESPCWFSDETRGRLLPIQASAVAIGYRLVIVMDPESKESYVALVEADSNSDSNAAKGWGTYVFRPGLADSFAVEIPRPLFERRSFEFGLNLFQRPRASALLVAGAHPRANLDGSADISKVANKTNLFNLVRHVLLRRMGNRPLLITQARAIQAPVDADVVLATDDGTNLLDDLTPLKKRLVDQLNEDRLDVAFVDGQQDTAGYELGILMQATAVQVSQNKEVVSLWLSPALRTRFREQSENAALAAQIEACGLTMIQQGLVDYLTSNEQLYTPHSDLAVPATLLPDGMKRELRDYVDTFDVLKLLSITQRYIDWNFTPLVDGRSGQAFLLISKELHHLPTVLNLTGFVSDHALEFKSADPETINAFIRARALWLQPARDNATLISGSSSPALRVGSRITSALVPSPSGRRMGEGKPNPEVIFDSFLKFNGGAQ